MGITVCGGQEYQGNAKFIRTSTQPIQHNHSFKANNLIVSHKERTNILRCPCLISTQSTGALHAMIRCQLSRLQTESEGSSIGDNVILSDTHLLILDTQRDPRLL